MSSSISVADAGMGFPAVLMHSAPGGTAVSSAAQAVAADTAQALRAMEQSRTLLGPKLDVLNELLAILDEFRAENWDGEGARGVDPGAVFRAEAFILALPEDVPLPEIAPEPDGSVSLDWIQSKHRLLSLSVSSDFRIAYAWLDGGEKGHAAVRFDGARIPERLLRDIRMVWR